MKRRTIAVALGILALVLCLAACGNVATSPKPDVSKLEFLGLNWGMTPEEAKAALALTDDRITEEKDLGDEWRITLAGEEYFGVDAESVTLRFLKYGDKCQLWNVQVTYADGTDMAKVRDGLVKIYGPGTDYGFTNYELYGGAVESYIDWNHTNEIQFGSSIEANAKNPRPKDEINHRWAGTVDGTGLFTEEETETIVALFGGGAGTSANREATLEYLQKKVWITILCRDGYTSHGVDYRPCVSFTGGHIGFNKQAYLAANRG